MGDSYKKNKVSDMTKGIRYEVEPFKDKNDIEKIKQFLLFKKDKRDYALFVFAINVGLRTQDILQLRIGDVSNSKIDIKKKVQVVEQKSKKVVEFEINMAASDALKLYFVGLKEYDKDAWLFPSRKGDKSLTVGAVRRIIKDFCKELNIKGNYGAYSLRKTFGYWAYINGVQTNPLVLVTLQKMFNHSTQAMTLRYIGIQSSDINNLYQTLNI